MFLDTANTGEIREAIKSGVFQGVTTNPTLLLKEKTTREQKIAHILEEDVQLLFVQAIGSTFEELYNDSNEILKLSNASKKVGVKISLNEMGLRVVSAIKKENPDSNILGTAIYSPDQGILGALAGCDYLAPYVNRMSNHGIDPFEAIRMMRHFIDERDLKSQIMAASFKTTHQVIQALATGAHTVTIPYEIFQLMINKEVALSAIDAFNRHGDELRLSHAEN